jgi:outer membrane protein assembly factor BamB
MKKILKGAALGFVLVVSCLACGKKDMGSSSPTPPGPPSQPPLTNIPSITSFTITDYCNRKMTIVGTNFNADISKDSVFFGKVKGIIDSATSTKLYAEYPQPTGLSLGRISVYANGLGTTWNDEVILFNPGIISFSPKVAGPGALVTIIGQHFDTTKVADSVYFNDVKGEIVSVAENQIVARVPQQATNGLIKVHSRCQVTSSTESFTFSNKGVVYISGNSNFLYALDISSGTAIWSSETHSGGFSGPTYDNGVVYIGSTDVNVLSNNYMYALNGSDGTEIWKFNAGPYDGIPAINNGVLYCGGFDQKLMALDAATGQKKWEFKGGDYFISGGPTYYEGKVYMRNDDGYFYCVDAENGNLIWRNMIWPGGNASVVNGIVYVAGSGMFYAFNAVSGDTLWMRAMPSLSGSSPTVVNGVVYIATENHQVYALNAESGDIIWQVEADWWVGSAVIMANNILYVHSGGGVIEAFDAANGHKIWAKALPGSDLPGACPVVANGMLFVGDDDGVLHALDATTGSSIWTFNTGGYLILSSPCVVDENGFVYHAGDSGNQQ